MNYELDCWLSRGVTAIAFSLIAMFLVSAEYKHIGTQDMFIMWGMIAVAFYGIVPKHVANWIFGFLLIALLCTLAVMFPIHVVALLMVFGALFAIIGAFA